VPRPKRKPPSKPPGGQQTPPGILELDRFSAASLAQWKTLSEDLDELHRVLYFAIEPERRRLRADLLAACQGSACKPLQFQNWVRLVSYTYSLNPLSAAGSLLNHGGRFNPGAELEEGTLAPSPALYLAENHETAYREKFQLATDEHKDGLSALDLALTPELSYSAVVLHGSLHRVFDATVEANFQPLARVLARIKMPARALQLMKKLRVSANALHMVKTAKQLHDAVLINNWRTLPVQFDLPSASQVLSDLIRAAGYEAILYPSTKGGGNCLAVFPDQLSDGSFVELSVQPPHPETMTRLDAASSEALCGWEILGGSRLKRP